MIEKCTIGENANDVVNVILGNGDVMFHGLFFDQHPERYCLGFYDAVTPHPIGSWTDEYNGKNSDQMPTPVRVVLSFEKPESVTALIHSLIELQKRMFNGEQAK